MLFSQIKPWENSDVIPQISTYWEVATDETFQNIIETKTTTGDSLYFFLSELTIPQLATYYVRATRQFTNTAANILLDAKPVSNIDSILNNNIIHRDPVKVDRPFLYINETEFKNPDFPDFEVKTSQFRCKQDGHVATNWIVTDINGNIIFKSLYDRYDKISKRFDKTNDLLNKTSLIFHVSHVSTNGVESETCRHVLTNEDFNFDVVGLFNDIPPYRELRLYVSPLESLATDISSIWLKKVNEHGEVSKSIPVTPTLGTNVIIIPGEELSYGAQLYLDVYGVNANREQSIKRYKLSVQQLTYTGELFPHVYAKKFEKYNPANFTRISNSFPNGFVVSEIPNGNILIPLGSGINVINPTIFKTSYRSTANGPAIEIDVNDYGKNQEISLTSQRVDGTMFKMMNDNILLVENYKEVDTIYRPCFRVYSYDLVNDTFTLLHEKTRTDETHALGVQNCIVQISKDTVWYLPQGIGEIREYNFVTNEANTAPVVTLPSGNQWVAMFYNRRVGKLILVNGQGNTFSVDVETRVCEESSDVPFTEWRNGRKLKAIELLNGDSLILNVDDMSAPSSIVYYDAMLNEYKPILKKVDQNYQHIGIIVTRSFSVYMINKQIDGQRDLLVNRLY